jgi:hypothetical protein
VELDMSMMMRAPTGGAMRTSVTLPELGRHDWIAVSIRMHRDGIWHYHPEPQSLFSFDARLGSGEVWYETVPTARSRNGPGCPWVVYKMRAGESWSGRELQVTLRQDLSEKADIEVSGFAYRAWWSEREPSFRAASGHAS